MCGRFTLRTPASELAKFFQMFFEGSWTPRFNIAPTQPILAIRKPVDSPREATWLHWGFVPSWAKDKKLAASLINARAETLAEKPAFRASFRRKRCLIVADGFYEWERIDAKTKQPHLFSMADESPFTFAGLWDRWTAPDGSALESATIVTTESNSLLARFHDRMPVILPAEVRDVWLDPQIESRDVLQPLLMPFDPEQMKSERVSPVINNVRNEVDPRLGVESA